MPQVDVRYTPSLSHYKYINYNNTCNNYAHDQQLPITGNAGSVWQQVNTGNGAATIAIIAVLIAVCAAGIVNYYQHR